MKKLVLLLLLVLIAGCNANNEDAFEIIKKVNEKYENMQSFKAVKITKQQGYIITAIEDLYIKGDKYKIVEDENIEISDGKTIWKYKIDNEAPDKVVLHLPEDNAITNANPDFSFYGSDEEIYGYTLQIDKNKEFSSDKLPEFEDGNDYYWRVYVTDVHGNLNKDEADIRKFRVDNAKKIEDKDIIPKIDTNIVQIRSTKDNPKIYFFTRIDNLDLKVEIVQNPLTITKGVLTKEQEIIVTSLLGDLEETKNDVKIEIDAKIVEDGIEIKKEIEGTLTYEQRSLFNELVASLETKIENEVKIEIETLELPLPIIKGNVAKTLQKYLKIKTIKNKIIHYTGEELAKPGISNKDFNVRDYIQWVYNILDLYALNFKIKGEENNHYIIKGTEAKDRVDNFAWSSIEVWVNKDDYTIWKLKLYQEINGGEYLQDEYIYEEVSFDELSDELFVYHEEKKEID